MTTYFNPTSDLKGQIGFGGVIPPAPAQMKKDAQAFVAAADKFAKSIINHETWSSRPVETNFADGGPRVVHHHHHHDAGWGWGWGRPFYERPVVIVNNDRDTCHVNDKPKSERKAKEEEKKSNDAVMFALGLAALGIAATAGAYMVGSSLGPKQEAETELADTVMFRRKLEAYNTGAKDDDRVFVPKTHELASLKERICARNYNSAVFDLGAKVALVAGLAIMGGGLVAASYAAATTTAAFVGGGVTLTSVAAMAFKWGFDSNDKANVRDAQAMRAVVLEVPKF